MSNGRLDNYLRTFRRKTGLTQPDVAFLLCGRRCGTLISRHEKRRRQPSLDAALGYRALYGVPVEELFAGRNERRTREIKGRMLALQRRLENETRKPGAGAREAAKKKARIERQLQP